MAAETRPEFFIDEENEFAIDGIYTRKPMVALITGITGQDGSYLAELLLEKVRLLHSVSYFFTHYSDSVFRDTSSMV